MTNQAMDRREFLKSIGVGIVYLSGLELQMPAMAKDKAKDFFFVQLSDCHWGFEGAKVNPDFAGTLPKAIKEVNSLVKKPDFVVFTGDLIHTHDDPIVRKKRMTEFKSIVSELDVKDVRYLCGEHDAALDNGEMFKEFWGETRYTFDHDGVHFIAIDNASDPNGQVGEAQLEWLKQDLKGRDPNSNIIVLTHRPLFPLYPQWDWATKDGDKVIEALLPFKHVSVFYGHIHLENHHMTEHIAHHSALSLMMPMPQPGSMPKRTPIPWDASSPYKNMGFREVSAKTKKSLYELAEYPIKENATI